MWTAETRDRYNRDQLRYPSDLTDEDWSLVGPLIPPAKRGGRRRSVNIREVVNGLLYIYRALDVYGAMYRRIFRPKVPCSSILIYGPITM